MDITPMMEAALALFREHKGILRTSDALRLGIHPRSTLYALRDASLVEPLSRGLYRLTELPPLANPDLVTVAHKIPQAVVCLVSALAFHGLTTQIPHAGDIALPPQVAQPTLAYPPSECFVFPVWRSGKRSKPTRLTPHRCASMPRPSAWPTASSTGGLGLDIVLEALRAYRAHPAFQVDTLLSYAHICRVDNVMRPYLETLL